MLSSMTKKSGIAKAKKPKKLTERNEKRKEWFNKKKNIDLKKSTANLDDLSESDFDSNDDLSMDDEEYGTLTDTEDESDSDALDEMPEPDVSVSEDSEDEKKPKHQPAQRIPTEEDARTVFVGNLPNTATANKLKKWFSYRFGKVESIRLRCPPRADPSIPKKVAIITQDFHEDRTNIIAFIKFEDKESADKALEANGMAFDENHNIRVDSSIKKTNFDSKKAIFVGNLPFDAEENQLRDIFAECGDIESIRIVRDRKTCVGKGFAYVNFKERHSVQLALEHDGVPIGKRELRVQKADYSKSRPNKVKESKRPNFSQTFKHKDNSETSYKNKKSIFQGEISKVKQKHQNLKKTAVNKRKHFLKQILNKDEKSAYKKKPAFRSEFKPQQKGKKFTKGGVSNLTKYPNHRGFDKKKHLANKIVAKKNFIKDKKVPEKKKNSHVKFD